jgi:ribosomal protein L29
MAKFKELKNLGKKEVESKIKELQLDLIKAKVTASKGGKVKIRELRKTLARLNALKNKS